MKDEKTQETSLPKFLVFLDIRFKKMILASSSIKLVSVAETFRARERKAVVGG